MKGATTGDERADLYKRSARRQGSRSALLTACRNALSILHEEPVRTAAGPYGGHHLRVELEAAIAVAEAEDEAGTWGHPLLD